MSSDLATLKIGIDDAARLLGVSRPRLYALAEEGKIPPPVGEQWILVDLFSTYIKFIRDDAKRVADAELKRAKVRDMLIRTAEREGRLGDWTLIRQTVNDCFGIWVSRIRALPTRWTRDLQMREKMENDIDAALAECEQEFRNASASLRSGRDSFAPAGKGDA